MRNYFFPALAGLSLLLSNCSNNATTTGAEGQVLAATDFEQFDGWLNDSPALAALTRDKAHSGKFSTVAGSGHEFSLGYNNLLGNLSPEWPTRLTVKAWVFVPNEQSTVKLVTEVKNADASKPNLWEGLDLAKEVRGHGKWQRLEHTITLPANARPESRFLVYLWAPNPQPPVYLDDLQITRTGK